MIGGDRLRNKSYSPPSRSRAPGSSKEPTNTLFVGNLPFLRLERDVAEIFDRVGPLRNVCVG
jgi:RNA recognition motif-containing protein